MNIRRVTNALMVGAALVAVSGVPSMSFQPTADDAETIEEVKEAPAGEARAQDQQSDGADSTEDGAASTGSEAGLDPTMVLGEELYTENCVSCHGADGRGSARVLAGNENLEYAVLIASQVIHGGEFMPRFPDLTDEDIAAIGTYIRNSWGNEFGPVTAEDIGQYR